MPKKAIILGAGPAGLAVARELLQRTDIQPILLEPAQEPDDIAADHEDPFLDYLTCLRPQLRKNFGWLRRIRIYLSRLWAQLFLRPERNLEDYIINKFGRQFYMHFFMHYAAKVWGIPCHSILAGWEREADKEGFSYTDTHDITQRIEQQGGKILHHQYIYAIYSVPHAICSVHVIDSLTGELSLHTADYFFSTIPVRDLIRVVQAPVPEEVRNIADHLLYRDVVKVEVELSQIDLPDQRIVPHSRLEFIGDQLYILDEDLTVSRVRLCDDDDDKGSARIVMEYYCTRGDHFWLQDNATIRSLAIDELEKMGLATSNDIMAMRVRRLEKAIQVYAGSYAHLHTVKSYTESFQNLFLVDRGSIPVWT
jgi:protoporphyrinogen oxidase